MAPSSCPEKGFYPRFLDGKESWSHSRNAPGLWFHAILSRKQRPSPQPPCASSSCLQDMMPLASSVTLLGHSGVHFELFYGRKTSLAYLKSGQLGGHKFWRAGCYNYLGDIKVLIPPPLTHTENPINWPGMWSQTFGAVKVPKWFHSKANVDKPWARLRSNI